MLKRLLLEHTFPLVVIVLVIVFVPLLWTSALEREVKESVRRNRMARCAMLAVAQGLSEHQANTRCQEASR
jgi:hypothetical protein